MARPSKVDQWLTEDGLNLLTYLKQTGMTDAQIADEIGIHERVLRKWKERYEPIKSALKTGKTYAIAEAYKALRSMFKVQTLTETITQEWTDHEGNKHQTVTTKVKEIPPDKTAIIFYMKAQAGWRENTDIVDTSALDKLDELLNQTQEDSLAEIEKEEEEKEDGEE